MLRKRNKIVHHLARLILVLIFFACSIFIVASANGFLFNKDLGQFEETGIINLTVEQTPVTVILNGKKKIYRRDPINLSYLLPGTYDVVVQKNNYFDWNKSFTISAGEVILNPFIILFYSKPTILPATADQIKLLENFNLNTPDDEMDIRGNEIWVKPITRTYPIITTTDQLELISRFMGPVNNARWYGDKTHIIFQIENEIRIIDRDGSNDNVLATLASSDPTDFIITNDAKTLIYRDGEMIYQRELM